MRSQDHCTIISTSLDRDTIAYSGSSEASMSCRSASMLHLTAPYRMPEKYFSESENSHKPSTVNARRLMRQIAAYERAVGRAFLQQQARQRSQSKLAQNGTVHTSQSPTVVRGTRAPSPNSGLETCSRDTLLSSHLNSSNQAGQWPSQYTCLRQEQDDARGSYHGMEPMTRNSFPDMQPYAYYQSDNRPAHGFEARQGESTIVYESTGAIGGTITESGRQERSTLATEHAPAQFAGHWSAEMDARLRAEVQAQQKDGEGPLQWAKIARNLNVRSGSSCQARWAEVLDEKVVKGRWSKDEDDLLINYYNEYGAQWSKIANKLLTRTQRQCRSRWFQIQAARVEYTSKSDKSV